MNFVNTRRDYDMKRDIFDDLVKWKDSTRRKPLILTGAYVKIGLNQEKPYKTRV